VTKLIHTSSGQNSEFLCTCSGDGKGSGQRRQVKRLRAHHAVLDIEHRTAEELGLRTSLHLESRLYHATLGLQDHAEGFQALLARPKRAPQ
jgi:hypothetical protein